MEQRAAERRSRIQLALRGAVDARLEQEILDTIAHLIEVKLLDVHPHVSEYGAHLALQYLYNAAFIDGATDTAGTGASGSTGGP